MTECPACGDIGCVKCMGLGDAMPADHGIEPAQLREKVEALEIRCAAISATASIAIGTVSDRLDAALKRIEQLEAQQSMWRGNKRPPAPIDSEDV